MKKYIISFILISILSCSLSGCFLDDEVPEETVVEYVKENIADLETFVEENRLNKLYERTGYAKEHFGKKTIVKGISNAPSYKYVEFYCGGSGLSVGSTYCGFYYSKDGKPHTPGIGDAYKLIETEPGIYEYKSADGRTSSYSRHIEGEWYYYYIVCR